MTMYAGSVSPKTSYTGTRAGNQHSTAERIHAPLVFTLSPDNNFTLDPPQSPRQTICIPQSKVGIMVLYPIATE